MLREGKGVREVALRVGVHAGSVSRWKKRVETNGPEGLNAKPGPGGVARLTRSQQERLRTLLAQGPVARGYKTALWTLRRVAEGAARRFAFEYLPPYAPDLNPVEYVWRHTKHADLANFIPDDLDHPAVEVTESLDDQRAASLLLYSFFNHAGLTL